MTPLKEAIVSGFISSGTYFTVNLEIWQDDVTHLGSISVNLDKSTVQQPNDWRTLYQPAANTILNGYGYANPTTYICQFDAESYNGLSNLPVAPSVYQALISQSGSSAPTGATLINSYAGSPTFTLARTGAGIYTITASSAAFSLTKTGLLFSPLANPLANLTYVVTSTTVMTIKTSITTLTSLLGLGFTSSPTDALLAGTMIYIPTFA